MDRTSREYRNHPVRGIYARAASGWATPDEQELSQLNIPDELRAEVRHTASILWETSQAGDVRAKSHARTVAEERAAEHIAAIPREFADSIRSAPADNFDSAAAKVVAVTRLPGECRPAHPAAVT